MTSIDPRGHLERRTRHRRVETLTVLVVDTVDSVRLQHRLGDDRANPLYELVEATLRKAVSRAGGETVKGRGDGILAVFPSASSAIRAACSAFQTIYAWEDESSRTLRLRSGIDVGDVDLEPGDVRGTAVAAAARLESSAEPDSILCTAGVVALTSGHANWCRFEAGPRLSLKGFPDDVDTYVVDWTHAERGHEFELPIPRQLEAELQSSFPFADRGEQMEWLHRLGREPGASLALVLGPTGIGKTRLAAEWAAEFQHEGGFVLYATLDRGRPKSTLDLLPAFSELHESAAHHRLIAASPRYREAWNVLAAAEAATHADADAPGLPDPADSIQTVIRELADDSPTALIVDDLQFASPTKLGFLEGLLRHTRSDLALVGLYTTGAAPRDTVLAEEALAEQFPLSAHVSRIELQPLDLAGVIEWLEHQPMRTLGKPAPVPLDETGRQIAEAFFDASGGIPNLLGLVIRDSYERDPGVQMDGDGRWRANCDIDVLRSSQAVEQMVRDRLRLLAGDVRDVLDLSAVIGEYNATTGSELDYDLLHRITGRSFEELDGLLGEARARHFIRMFDGNDRFETDAIRRAVYRAINPLTRAGRHEAVAEALGERAAADTMLPPDVRIARHLTAVAEARQGYKADLAAQHFLSAARRSLRTHPQREVGSRGALDFAYDALSVLKKFELVDDEQLRTDARQVIQEAEAVIREVGHGQQRRPAPEATADRTDDSG
jgi:class 3 adenylate cyclase